MSELTSRPSRRLVFWAVRVASVAVVALAGLWWSGSDELPPAPAAPSNAAASANERLPGPAAAHDGLSRVATGAGVAPQIAAQSSPTARACAGIALITENDGSAAALDIQNHQRVMSDLSQRLKASTDPALRASGWLLDAMHGADPQMRPLALASTAQLAAAAQTGQQPTVYAWALEACGNLAVTGPVPDACQALSHQRWAELGPNQVWPWLAMASDAQRAGDLSGFENAMHRASLASDWQNPGREFQRQLLSQIPDGLSDADRAGTLLPGIMVLSSLSGRLTAVIRYCPNQQDANRHQNCVALAERMLDQADNLLDLRLGLVVAKRSGLSESRLAVAKMDSEAADRVARQGAAKADRPEVVCGHLQSTFRRAVRTAQVGELQALREDAARLPQ